jgi:riboflavin-specific deaminase-like protein
MASVFVNMAITLDGKIAGAFGERVSLGSEADRREMDRLRARADVILWGGETLRKARCPALVLDPALIAAREEEGRPPQPANAVLTSSGRLPGSMSWFGPGARARLILTHEGGAGEAEAAASGRAEVAVLGKEEVSAVGIVDHLAGRGFERILLEGGGRVHWMFAEAGLVDVWHVTLTPVLAGGAGAPTLLDGPGFPADRFMRLNLEEVRREGGEIFLKYSAEKQGRGLQAPAAR